MPQDFQNLYEKVIRAQELHSRYLDTVERNLGYYFFGKNVPLVKKLTFPQIDFIQALTNYTPEAYNPLFYLINSFIEEIANSTFYTEVKPYPLAGKEPYESFADQLEDYLEEIHRKARRQEALKAILLSIVAQGYFALYSDGKTYYFLSPYEFFPGDRSIPGVANQPFVVRKTYCSKASLVKNKKINLQKEALEDVYTLPDLDLIQLYDVWSLPQDLNVCYTQTGQVLYHQPFPHPKRYPFFLGIDNALLNSFYSQPFISTAIPLLVKYQAALSHIEESAKSIANPILTYDADAGIDVNALQRALKEGYKRIIVGKNREGDLNFKAPGQLPAYAQLLPDSLLTNIMRLFGINETFLGTPSRGVRERAAMGRLIRITFRKLSSFVRILEQTFSDLDNYLIDYLKEHQLTFKESGFKEIETIFQGEVKYIAKETFRGFESEDVTEKRNLAMLGWMRKLLPQEETLKEFGYTKPKQMIKALREEMLENQKLAIEAQSLIKTPPKSLLDQITERLKGKLDYRFSLIPVADGKVLVQCQQAEEKKVAFLLSDFADKVFVESVKEKQPPTLEQKTLEVKVEEPMESQETQLDQTGSSGETEQAVETRGRPRTKPIPPGFVFQEALKRMAKEKVKEEMEKKEEEGGEGEEVEVEKEEGVGGGEEGGGEGKKKTEKKPEEISIKSSKSKSESSESRSYSEIVHRQLVKKRRVWKPDRWLNKRGFYIVEPHAKWIAEGRKTLLLKAKKFDIINEPLLLLGDKVYGVIIVRDIVDKFDVEATRRHHLVSAGQIKKWWKNKKLYLYLFEFHPFPEPLDYEFPLGVQNFVSKVKIKAKDVGVPPAGDLKPIAIKPWIVPPPHKPEKKAFQPHEVFTLSRLREIIPEGSYDVSFKVDGLRTFLWVHNGEARMFSDVGNRFDDKRVKPLLDAALKIFPHTVLIDGELVMKGIERKDIAGYIHGKWNPTPEQLESLRYICWDILYVKDRSIASLPFLKRAAILDLYLPYKARQTGKIQRVRHVLAKNRDKVAEVVKKVTSHEGAIIRDVDAAYWATHSSYKCFHGDTRLFTSEGIKQVRRINLGDRILSSDGNFYKVIMKEKKPIHGVQKFLTIIPWFGLPLTVTPDHLVMTEEGWKPAEDIVCLPGPLRDRQKTKKVDFVALPSYQRKKFSEPEEIILQGPQGYSKKIHSSQNFWYFIGRWIGDGSKNGKGSIQISFNAKELDDINRIKKLITDLFNTHVTETKTSENGLMLVFQDLGLDRYLNQFRTNYRERISKAFTKTLPEFIDGLSFENFKALFQGWLDADSGTTVDQALASRFYLLALSWGIPVSLKTYRGNYKGVEFIYYKIVPISQTYGLKKKGSVFFTRVKEIKQKETRVEFVYDFTLEKGESLVGGIQAHNCKFMWDIDIRVFAQTKTKIGLPIFFCELRDGTYIGSTYAQSEVTAKNGDVIRVNVEHVTLRPDGSVNWYAPRPRSWKEGKITPKRVSTTQVGIGGPDTIDLIKEIYLAGGGTEAQWNAWWPKHEKWKKEVMPGLKKRIVQKIKEGVEVSKIVT